jgi:hypothetical protein
MLAGFRVLAVLFLLQLLWESYGLLMRTSVAADFHDAFPDQD